MTKEEVILCIQQLKTTGLSYKGIAQQAGLKQRDVYDYISRQTPCARIHQALEKYFTKGDENK